MERSKAAESGETASRHLLAKLRDREMELKEAQEKSHEEMTGLHKQIQNLQAELNKKDYELQVRSSFLIKCSQARKHAPPGGRFNQFRRV